MGAYIVLCIIYMLFFIVLHGNLSLALALTP